MKKLALLSLSVMLAFTVSCKDKEEKNKKADDKMVETKKEMKSTTLKAKAALEAESDSQLSGNVVFKEENGNVTMTALVSGLEEGKHAIHIHEKGDCSAGDGTSAGGHWNPTNEPHGKWGSQDGYHKGDIGNFNVDNNGNGSVTLTTDEWCIGCDDPNKDITNKAIIVHQGVDDFTSQPSGAAGTRVGCGVINKM